MYPATVASPAPAVQYVPAGQPVYYAAAAPVPQQQVYMQPQPVMYAAQPVQMQPVQMQPMQVAYGQPAGQPASGVYGAVPTNSVGSAPVAQPVGIPPSVSTPWQTDSLKCLECGPEKPFFFCLGACFCPCYAVGVNDSLRKLGRPDECSGGCIKSCAIFSLGMIVPILSLFYPVHLGMERGQTRKRFNIQGDVCTDCLVNVYCWSCALTQEKFEIEKRLRDEQRFAGPPPNTMA